MTAPRLSIDIDKIHRNARHLVDLLAVRGIAVTGVTKSTLGLPAVAFAMLRGGVTALGDSRVENIVTLRDAGVTAPIVLLRTPMLSQVDRVVALTSRSSNTEFAVLRALSLAAVARGITHDVLLMVELGDLREGILPEDLASAVAMVLPLPGIELVGIGANLACRHGVVPDADNMGELSALADAIDERFAIRLRTVSGGNSGNLSWALGDHDVGRINELRLGESILLGRDPLDRRPIVGLHTDAITLAAEVIEVKVKPSQPWGETAQNAFGAVAVSASPSNDGQVRQAILAIGRQDADPAGMSPPAGVAILGASSDHLIVDAGDRILAIGEELRFGLSYGALLRAMTSPFVAKVVVGAGGGPPS